MRHDPFFREKTLDPDAVVKSAPVRKSVTDNDLRDAWNASNYQLSGPFLATSALCAPSSGTPYIQVILIDESAVIVIAAGKKFKVPYSVDAESGEITFDVASAEPVREAWGVVGKAARPPGPKVIEIDGDQDSVARESESDDPTDSFRPGYVTDAPAEGGCLFSPTDVEKVWSDEAREAAAEARRRNAAPALRPQTQRALQAREATTRSGKLQAWGYTKIGTTQSGWTTYARGESNRVHTNRETGEWRASGKSGKTEGKSLDSLGQYLEGKHLTGGARVR